MYSVYLYCVLCTSTPFVTAKTVHKEKRLPSFGYYNPGQNVWDTVPFSRIPAMFARSPLPPDAMLDDSSASLSLRTTLHGGNLGEFGRIWPKERLFPCEKLIDGRGSAFCKLVSHNFGQDCSVTQRSLCKPNSKLYDQRHAKNSDTVLYFAYSTAENRFEKDYTPSPHPRSRRHIHKPYGLPSTYPSVSR